MANRTLVVFATALLLSLQCPPAPALADNQMGYQLLTAEQASALPRNGGKLGLNVGRAQQINSSGITFELLKMNSVTPRSPGALAGFKAGDQIISVDGKVFPSVAAFAAYVGSMRPSDIISVDYMLPSGGPQDAQRVKVTLGGTGQITSQAPDKTDSTGLSTGTKIAVGVGAAALFGCYKMGCFSHKVKPGVAQQPALQK